jgi:hypothetical protein
MVVEQSFARVVMRYFIAVDAEWVSNRKTICSEDAHAPPRPDMLGNLNLTFTITDDTCFKQYGHSPACYEYYND